MWVLGYGRNPGLQATARSVWPRRSADAGSARAAGSRDPCDADQMCRSPSRTEDVHCSWRCFLVASRLRELPVRFMEGWQAASTDPTAKVGEIGVLKVWFGGVRHAGTRRIDVLLVTRWPWEPDQPRGTPGSVHRRDYPHVLVGDRTACTADGAPAGHDRGSHARLRGLPWAPRPGDEQ